MRGPASIREGDEEGVPLGVHLDATVASECLANDAALLGQRVHITLAQLLEQARRSFDVGEEEGDGAGREVAPHSIIMNQRGAELTLRHTRGSSSRRLLLRISKIASHAPQRSGRGVATAVKFYELRDILRRRPVRGTGRRHLALRLRDGQGLYPPRPAGRTRNSHVRAWLPCLHLQGVLSRSRNAVVRWSPRPRRDWVAPPRTVGEAAKPSTAPKPPEVLALRAESV